MTKTMESALTDKNLRLILHNLGAFADTSHHTIASVDHMVNEGEEEPQY